MEGKEMQKSEYLKLYQTDLLFQKFREHELYPQQLKILRFLNNSKCKVSIICAPCGSGKSLAGMLYGAAVLKQKEDFKGGYRGETPITPMKTPIIPMKTPMETPMEPPIHFNYICNGIQLQSQLQSDFPMASVMKGRTNFKCSYIPALTAENCVYEACPPQKREMCAYKKHKVTALLNPVRILNYAYVLNEVNYIGQFSANTPLWICDEADTLDQTLQNMIELRFSINMIKSIGKGIPKFKTPNAKNGQGLELWKQWAREVREVVKNRLLKLQKQLSNSGIDKKQKNKKQKSHLERFTELNNNIKRTKRMLERINIFLDHVSEDWIFEEQKNSRGQVKAYSWKPLWMPEVFAEQYLWRHAEKFVLMSATFPPRQIVAKTMGIKIEDIDYLEIKSDFPVKNRPVIIVDNPVDMRFKQIEDNIQENKEKLLKTIGRILTYHKGQRGIIHTHSWKINEWVMKNRGVFEKRTGHVLVSHKPEKDDKEKIQTRDIITKKFVEEQTKLKSLSKLPNIKLPDIKLPSIFVSPSSNRGLDLPNDLARFAIICKAPFLNLKDKQVSQRLYKSDIGRLWYKINMILESVQMMGRIVRSRTDWGKVYIIDLALIDSIAKDRKYWPKYILEAVEVE